MATRSNFCYGATNMNKQTINSDVAQECTCQRVSLPGIRNDYQYNGLKVKLVLA